MKMRYLVLTLCIIALINLILGPVFLGLFYLQKVGALYVWVDLGVFVISFIGVWTFTKES
jgi:hypothetical protein